MSEDNDAIFRQHGANVRDRLDYGRCDRCRYFSPLARSDTFEKYVAGICHWKWRKCSPYEAVPLVAHDSRCEAFEKRRMAPLTSQERP